MSFKMGQVSEPFVFWVDSIVIFCMKIKHPKKKTWLSLFLSSLVLEIDSRYSSFMNVSLEFLGDVFLSSIFLSTVPCILPAVGCVAAQHHSSTSQWQRSASSARSTRGKEEEKEIEEREGTCQSTGQKIERIFRNPTTKINDHFK